MPLTLQEATHIIAGALEKAEEFGIKVSVAVCDAGGRLVAFNRMDGAVWASIFSSQGKAAASAAFGRPSLEVAEWAETPLVQRLVTGESSVMVLSQGGVPIIRQGVLEGACGVGGGTGKQDEECALAGVAKGLDT